MKCNDEHLERLVAAALRGTAPRTAPPSLERRVLRAIENRAARPWWREEFGRWPALARAAFLIASAGLVYLALGAPLWLWESSRAGLPAELSLLQTLMQTPRVIVEHLPSVLVYSAIAALVMLYATLFGVGAIAYRSLLERSEKNR